MPYHKKTYMQGNLFVHFKITFPTTIDSKSLALVSEALKDPKVQAAKSKSSTEDGVETVQMVSYQEQHRNAHHGGGDKGNDSEEDEDDGHPHGQRIGCQSQ